MNPAEVKTYKQVNRDDVNVSFGISRMEDYYDSRSGEADQAHRHQYYTVVVPLKANGIHHLDFKSYPLKDGNIFFISPGQIHQIIEHERSVGYALVFSEDFLLLHNIPFSFIEDLNLFRSFDDSAPLTLPDEKQTKIKGLLEDMILAFKGKDEFKFEEIAALLKLFLIECHKFCPEKGLESESGNSLFRRFREMVEKQHKDWHHIKDYASALAVSPDHLNRLVKSASGCSAKTMVSDRLTVAAKRLLFYSDLSIKEIADQLGFEEPANFSAFFKKQTGASPLQFKKTHIGFS